MKYASFRIALILAASWPLWSSPSGWTLTPGFEPPVNYPVQTLPEDFGFGDVDNDGITDVVVANSDANSKGGGNSVTTLLATGDGTLLPAGSFPVGDRPEGLMLALINGDANLDVVTANHEGNSISVLLGRGDGTFDPAIDTAVPGGPRDVVAQDFNGDGHTDFATADFNAGTLTILFGDGTGNATISQTLASGAGTEQISICNFNGDEFADLVLANRHSDTITAFEGNASGNFTLRDSELAHNETRFIVPIDLTGNGMDDLFVSNWGREDVQIFINDGGRDFDAMATLTDPEMNRPLGVHAADVNKDGNVDVLVAATGADSVHIFLGESDPFTSRTSSDIKLDAGESPIQVATHDIDEDGFLDLFITEAHTNVLKLHRSYLGNPGMIVDNGDAGTTSSGTWATSEGEHPIGTESLSSDSGAQYRWEVPTTRGDYEVFLWWTVTGDRFEAVAVDVDHAGGTEALEMDQSSGPGFWHSLGVYTFDDLATVTVTAPSGLGRTGCADAVRLVAIPGQPNLPPVAQIESVAPAPAMEGTPVEFVGMVADMDGTVAFQSWQSNIDGFLSDDLSFTTTSLTPGTHEITLLAVDNNGATTSEPVELIVTPSPVDPPLAAAGDDQEMSEGNSVTLDGSASAPSDGGPLTYSWSQISGRTVLLQNADSAVATFQAPAVLADEELVFQLTVTEGDLADADTVTVMIEDVGVGMASFTRHSRPSNIDVDPDNRLVLAFHGSLSVANDNEATDWTEMSFRALGDVDPGAEIVQAWLYLDSNRNGIYDDADEQIGNSASFAVGSDTLRFRNFAETLINGESRDFFVVCEQTPPVAVDGLAGVPLLAGATTAKLLAALTLTVLVALAALVLRDATRAQVRRLALVSSMAMIALTLPLAGCGGGGGGGGGGPAPETEEGGALQLELFDVQLTGTDSGLPAAVDGLPIAGWELD